MSIKKGDRLVHRPTGMRGLAVADEDAAAMVLVSQQGVLALYPAGEWAAADPGGAGWFHDMRGRSPVARPSRRHAVASA